MIPLRQFILVASADSASSTDAQICTFFHIRDGNKGSRWDGTSIRTDGQYGVLWDDCCLPVFDGVKPATDTEVIDPDDGTSNWGPYTPAP